MNKVNYADISEQIPDPDRPVFDIVKNLDAYRLNEKYETQIRERWQDGVVHLKRFIPTRLIDEYCKLRAQDPNPAAWNCPVPYVLQTASKHLFVSAAHGPHESADRPRDGLALELDDVDLDRARVSRGRLFESPFVNSHYCAVWMALEDIAPESGPFQYVPGSHKWPTIRRHKILERLTPEQQRREEWPVDTQDWIHAACLEEIERRGARIETYLPDKGDALLWHGCLLHRGSPPAAPGAPRRALISHYSSIHHRPDWPLKKKWNGQWYFIHGQKLDAGAPPPNV